MTLKTLLVVFLLVLSVGFSVSLEDFLNVSLLDEVQDNRAAPSVFQEPPLSVVISWMEKPPYVMFDEEQGPSPGFKVKGIFQEIVYKGLQICTDIRLSEVNFAEKADNLRQLDETIVKKEADLALPVQGNEDGSYGGHTYVEVLKSPGVVFIVDKQQTLKHLRKRVLQAMKDTWPVIILTLLLAGFAGILIWGLVSVYIFNNLRKILLT